MRTPKHLARSGAVLTVALAATACQSESCPLGCPATYVSVSLDVTSPSNGPVAGVKVTFTGPATGGMRCDPQDALTLCSWPSGPVTEGNYLLQVTAPGFMTANVSSDLVVAADPRCGCASATLNPSTVTLSPM